MLNWEILELSCLSKLPSGFQATTITLEGNVVSVHMYQREYALLRLVTVFDFFHVNYFPLQRLIVRAAVGALIILGRFTFQSWITHMSFNNAGRCTFVQVEFQQRVNLSDI